MTHQEQWKKAREEAWGAAHSILAELHAANMGPLIESWEPTLFDINGVCHRCLCPVESRFQAEHDVHHLVQSAMLAYFKQKIVEFEGSVGLGKALQQLVDESNGLSTGDSGPQNN